MDVIKIQILDDGTIKTETDKVSMPNHQNAEMFLRETFKLAGGKATMKFKRGLAVQEAAHSHTHEHGHSH